MAALEDKLQRLENFVVEADDDLADDVDELANDDEDDGESLVTHPCGSGTGHTSCLCTCLGILRI